MTLSDSLLVSNDYPHIKTQALAFCEAVEMSSNYPHLFIYVRLSTTTGMYTIDLIGNPYSDNKVIAAFKNGMKTL